MCSLWKASKKWKARSRCKSLFRSVYVVSARIFIHSWSPSSSALLHNSSPFFGFRWLWMPPPLTSITSFTSLMCIYKSHLMLWLTLASCLIDLPQTCFPVFHLRTLGVLVTWSVARTSSAVSISFSWHLLRCTEIISHWKHPANSCGQMHFFKLIECCGCAARLARPPTRLLIPRSHHR